MAPSSPVSPLLALPLPGVLPLPVVLRLPGVLPLPGGLAVETFRLFAVLGAVAAAWTYTRLWRRAAPGTAAGKHLLPAGLLAYAAARLAAIATGGAWPRSFWDILGFDELTLSWTGAVVGTLVGVALAARRDGLSPRLALDAAACALAVGLAVGAWGTSLAGALHWSLAGAAAAAAGWSRFRLRAGSGQALALVLIILGLGRLAAGLVTNGVAVDLVTPARLGDLAWIAAGAALAVGSRLRPGLVVGALLLALGLVAGGLTLQAIGGAGEGAAGPPGGGSPQATDRAADLAPAQPVVGFRAPDFEARTIDGRVFRLSDLRGRPVMLNFWATWCEPCRIEMPEIQRAHERYGDRVAVVGVNVREPADLVRTFVEFSGYTWTFVLDPGSDVAELYRLRPIPTSFFIDASGVIRHIEYGIMTETAIRAVFDRLLQQTDAG